MNERVKKLWVDALRSGKYTQSKHALRTVSGYCCLGVLCDLATEESDIGKWVMTSNGWVFQVGKWAGSRDVLPPEIMAWAGVEENNPVVKNGSLAYSNDDGADFNIIAEMIEREL